MQDNYNPTENDVDNFFEDISFTENGDYAFSTSGNKALDFFTRIVRDAPVEDYVPSFVDMFNENNEIALKVLANLRDIRGGKGEKRIVQILLLFLKITNNDIYCSVIGYFIENGYWKDLLVICDLTKKYDKSLSNSVEIDLFSSQLNKDFKNLNNGSLDISLAAKWAPSEQTYYNRYPLKLSDAIRYNMCLTRRNYRNCITSLRKHLNVLEMNMSTHRFENIEFSKIPSVAHKNYRNAFKKELNKRGIYSEDRRILSKRYNEYIKMLKNGEEKINSVGVHPHELVGVYLNAGSRIDSTIEEQWKNISRKISSIGTFSRTMSVVDVSASMEGIPMRVAIALGILVSENTNAPFKNRAITFHSNPNWINIDGETLYDKVNKISNSPWGASTNILSVFNLILALAVKNNVKREHMVDTIFIFTDMQFDKCDESCFSGSSLDIAKSKYKLADYDMPTLIIWNLRTSDSKILPCSKYSDNVVLLSGFSAELLKIVLSMDKDGINPMKLFLEIISRYEVPKFKESTISKNNINQIIEKLKTI